MVRPHEWSIHSGSPQAIRERGNAGIHAAGEERRRRWRLGPVAGGCGLSALIHGEIPRHCRAGGAARISWHGHPGRSPYRLEARATRILRHPQRSLEWRAAPTCCAMSGAEKRSWTTRPGPGARSRRRVCLSLPPGRGIKLRPRAHQNVSRPRPSKKSLFLFPEERVDHDRRPRQPSRAGPRQPKDLRAATESRALGRRQDEK